jgi:RNA polymerase sigma factor (sigma-70 family)
MLNVSKKYFPDDGLLWANFKEGDEASFKELFERYADVLLKYGLTVIANREMVKDAIQDLFIEILRKRKKLASPESVKFYLIVSLRRLLISKNKTEIKRYTAVDLSESRYIVSHEKSVIEIMVNKEEDMLQAKILSDGIKLLPHRQQEAIFLRFYEGLEYEEISKVMSLNYQVVRNTVHRAVKALRTKLSAAFMLLLYCTIFCKGIFF